MTADRARFVTKADGTDTGEGGISLPIQIIMRNARDWHGS